MNRNLDKTLVVGIVLIVVILVISAGFEFSNTRQLNDNGIALAHTHELLEVTNAILLTLVDAETGVRGFISTGSEDFLEPYHAALARLGQTMAELKEKAGPDRKKQQTIYKLTTMAAAELELLKRKVELRRRQGDRADFSAALMEGKRKMDAIRAVVGELRDEELGVLTSRQSASKSAYNWAISTGLLSAGLGLGMVGAFILLVWRNLRLRSKAAARLYEQREWFRTTLASIGDAVVATDAEGRVSFLNPPAQALMGWRLEEVEGQPLAAIFNIVNEQTRQPAENPVARVLREGAIVGLANHTVLIARDGTERPIEDSAAPIRDSSNQVLGVVLVFRDVTERRGAERIARESDLRTRQLLVSLGESEARFAAVINHSPSYIFAKDPGGRYLLANQALATLVERSPLDCLGRTDADFFSAACAARFRADDKEVLETGRARIFEENIEHDGTQVTSLTAKFPLLDAQGNVYGVCGIATDITEQKRAREAMAVSEERLRLALEAGQMTVWDWNLLTDEIMGSDHLEPIHVLAPGTLGATLTAYLETVHPDDREAVARAVRAAIEQKSGYEIEFRHISHDGSLHWMAGLGKVFTAEDGRPVRLIGLGMDITKRKAVEEGVRFLADASATLAGLVDYESTLQKLARLAVPHFADWCAVDMLEGNGPLRRLAVAHVDPDKVQLAHDLHRRFPPDQNAAQGLYQVLRTGRSELVEEITDGMLDSAVNDKEQLGILRALGLRSYMCVPLQIRGRVLGAITFIAAESGRRFDAGDLAVAEDLAHRAAVAVENARLYHEVRQADKRKDEFLATLAHELRNPLAPIRNSLAILRMPTADRATQDQAHGMMERQVALLVRLVDDLLDVSRVVRGKI